MYIMLYVVYTYTCIYMHCLINFVKMGQYVLYFIIIIMCKINVNSVHIHYHV